MLGTPNPGQGVRVQVTPSPDALPIPISWYTGPEGLTISEEDDEVFGFSSPLLDLEGGIEGSSCLPVPESWILLLHWEGALPTSAHGTHSPRTPNGGHPQLRTSLGSHSWDNSTGGDTDESTGLG